MSKISKAFAQYTSAQSALDAATIRLASAETAVRTVVASRTPSVEYMTGWIDAENYAQHRAREILDNHYHMLDNGGSGAGAHAEVAATIREIESNVCRPMLDSIYDELIGEFDVSGN